MVYELYKRPLAAFFLPAPPSEPSPRQEFRTLPEEDLASLSRDTRLHLRKAHAYQLGLKDLYSNENPAATKIWRSITLSRGDDIAQKANSNRKHLGINLLVVSSWRDTEEASRQWRNAIESTGVFVFKAPFKQNAISGFCLKDPEFSLAYIKKQHNKD